MHRRHARGTMGATGTMPHGTARHGTATVTVTALPLKTASRPPYAYGTTGGW